VYPQKPVSQYLSTFLLTRTFIVGTVIQVNDEGAIMFKANEEPTNGITTGLEVRRQRGLEIAAMARIHRAVRGATRSIKPSRESS
jgi:hypothetical protein